MNTSEFVKIPKSFYEREDVVKIARELLGKYVFTHIGGCLTGGMIVETEAYDGRKDKACHAFLRRTKRTEVMYQSGGLAYIYLCYGIHHLFNIVTNRDGYADAVLVRAIEPIHGIQHMKERYGKETKRLTNGPGKLSKALGITKEFSGVDLTGDHIYLAEKDNQETPNIVSDVRIGIDYAEEDALLPWRFFINQNEWVSKQKTPVD